MAGKEINSVLTRNMLQYVEQRRPEELPALLEGLSEEQLSHPYAWVSYQTANRLFQRLEQLFQRDDIMREIARATAQSRSLGAAEWLIRLVPNVKMAFGIAVRYAHLFQNVARLQILGTASKRVRIALTPRPGFLVTRGSCHYTQGHFQALLQRTGAQSVSLQETHCAVPIWEKGLIEHSHFAFRSGRVLRTDLLTGARDDLGRPAADGSFAWGGTVYGAPRCVYDISWAKHGRSWNWLFETLFLRPRLIERIRRELISEYEMIDKQRHQLQRTNQILAQLLRERVELTTNLEAKIRERTRELEYSVARLQELDRQKTRFLSLTSHELRTPLTVVKGAISLLLSELGDLEEPRLEKYLNMARNNCERLIGLVDEVLDLTRLEARGVRFELRDVDMLELVRQGLEEFQAAAAVKKISLTGDLPLMLPKVRGDEARLRQIFNNLISNALKFTPARGQVSVGMWQQGQFVELVVADTGPGLAEQDQQKVFSKFYQVDNAFPSHGGGVGLGLAIVRELVHLHGGLVWVVSQPGQGSRFFVRLPFAGPPSFPQGPEIAARVDADPGKKPYGLP